MCSISVKSPEKQIHRNRKLMRSEEEDGGMMAKECRVYFWVLRYSEVVGCMTLMDFTMY